jgi:threonine dehydratase
MHALYKSGSQDGIEELPSVADGLAGPVEPESVTIPIVKALVDDFILVSESEIAEAMKFAWVNYGERIEGSGAVPLAAVLFGKIPTRPAVVVVSGGNVDDPIFQQMISREDGQAGG